MPFQKFNVGFQEVEVMLFPSLFQTNRQNDDTWMVPLVHNRARVLRARDLRRRSDRQSNAITSEEGRCCAGVAAQVEVDIRSILVGARKAILSAQWVALRRAQVVHHDDDTGSGIGQWVAARVRLASNLPASAAGWANPGTGSHSVEVLRHGRGETGRREEPARGSVGLAVRRAVAVP